MVDYKLMVNIKSVVVVFLIQVIITPMVNFMIIEIQKLNNLLDGLKNNFKQTNTTWAEGNCDFCHTQ